MTSDGAAKDSLAAIAHDLQTPLHVIAGYARLLLDQSHGQLAPGQRDVIERISSNARDLSDLVSDLVELAA